MKIVKIEGRDYISLSLSFFNEAMDKIDNNYDYDENFIPDIVRDIVKFSADNGYKYDVLVSDKFYKWMDIEYEKYPLPWRDSKNGTKN